MEEFKEKDDRLSLDKHEGDEHHDEKKVMNCPPYNSDFQLHDANPVNVLIQEKDFKSGPEDYSARTEPSIRTKHIEVDCESHHRNTLECSKEFGGKYDCNAPYLAKTSSHQDPTSAKDVTSTNISSASTSRPAKKVLSVDVTRRNKNRKVGSHHRKLGGKVSSTSNGVSKMEKGKEPIIYEADDCRSSSNRREDGREDFECISSKAIVSTVKRARICESESEKLVKGRFLKGLNGDNFSFRNWVASITSGLTGPHDGPTEAFQHPSQDMKGVISLPISVEKREYIGVSHGTRGFRSIFQALCYPDNNVSSSKIKHIDHQKEIDVGIEGEEASNVASCVLRERLNFGQISSFPDSSSRLGDGEKENISTGPATSGACGNGLRENDIESHNKVLASRKRISKEVSQVKNPPSAAVDSCAELTAPSRHASQNSLWITRLSRGFYSPPLESIQCLNCLDVSAQPKLPYLEAKKTRLSEYNSVSHADSHSSRLDALKHTNPLKISDEDTSTNKVCLICGMSECSELDHWAASCPNASSKGSQISFKANGFNEVNFSSTAKKKPEHQSFINYDGATELRSEGKKDHHQVLHGSTSSQKQNKDIGTDIVVCEEVRNQKNESAGCDTIDLRMDQVEDATISFFSENELKKPEFNSCCSRLPTTVMDEPNRIFIAVRKLRLSRMDVLRWMKSRVSHYNLAGFFLRLRIGKLETGCGGTGYHVGCINGASCQNSISVRVGSSTYSVTTPFISNHDFKEDELKAWWFQNLRDGTKMPSNDELNEKFQLRLKFGF